MGRWIDGPRPCPPRHCRSSPPTARLPRSLGSARQRSRSLAIGHVTGPREGRAHHRAALRAHRYPSRPSRRPAAVRRWLSWSCLRRADPIAPGSSSTDRAGSAGSARPVPLSQGRHSTTWSAGSRSRILRLALRHDRHEPRRRRWRRRRRSTPGARPNPHPTIGCRQRLPDRRPTGLPRRRPHHPDRMSRLRRLVLRRPGRRRCRREPTDLQLWRASRPRRPGRSAGCPAARRRPRCPCRQRRDPRVPAPRTSCRAGGTPQATTPGTWQ
jgi:hypothetical protein